MREKNVREINLTKENICFANKISVEDNVIAAECTLLFDVDKYFGTTTKRIILGLALMYAGLLMDQSTLNTVCVLLMTAANVLLIGV